MASETKSPRLRKTGKPISSPSTYSILADEHGCTAILSVSDKDGILDLCKGLTKHNVRLLASGVRYITSIILRHTETVRGLRNS